jgi:hypothetical protein
MALVVVIVLAIVTSGISCHFTVRDALDNPVRDRTVRSPGLVTALLDHPLVVVPPCDPDTEICTKSTISSMAIAAIAATEVNGAVMARRPHGQYLCQRRHMNG